VAAAAQLEFSLLVIDEAHEIFRPGVNREFLEKIPTHQRVLLSSRSQASSGGWLGDAEHNAFFLPINQQKPIHKPTNMSWGCMFCLYCVFSPCLPKTRHFS